MKSLRNHLEIVARSDSNEMSLRSCTGIFMDGLSTGLACFCWLPGVRGQTLSIRVGLVTRYFVMISGSSPALLVA